MKWTVGSKLVAGFSLIILVSATLAGVEAYQGRRIANALDRMYSGGIIATEALGDAHAAMQRVRGRVFYHMTATTEPDKRQIEQDIRELESELMSSLDTAKDALAGNLVARERIDDVISSYREFEKHREAGVYRPSRLGDTGAALEYMVNQTGAEFTAMAATLRKLITEQVRTNDALHTELKDVLQVSNTLSILGSALAALLAVGIAWLLARSISGRLRRVADTAERVSGGDLDARARIEGSDEISEVARSLNSMADSLAEKIQAEAQSAAAQAEQRRRLAQTLERYGKFVDQVARGELNAEITVSDDELADLGRNLDSMVKALRTMTLSIHEAVGSLSSASAEILTTVQEHSAGANESASAVSETVATVDEVSQSAKRAAEQAADVADASRKSVDVSKAGSDAVTHTVTTMEDVRREVDAIAKRILALSEQVQAVGQIVASVNELAEQSNLLALNASIEAARAGDEGRGFAVVAQEIRNLADQSRQATSEVRSILGDIQKSTTEAVLVTEQGSKAVGRALEAAQSAGTRIDQLAATIAASFRSAQQIQTAAHQQVQGVTQISQAMHSISEASKQTVDGTRNVETAARSLNELSGRLRDAVTRYRA